MIDVSIVGGSGFVGGELLRILLSHPEINVKQVTSERYAGRYLKSVHPHLRGRTNLKFSNASEMECVDLVFLALPHGESSRRIGYFEEVSERIIDLSADFRLGSNEEYVQWYGFEHPREELLDRFAYGIAEINREQIRNSRFVSSAGCNATASILSLYPLAKEGMISDVLIDAKVGTSEGGRKSSEASHHPVRSGSIRSYRPVMHRHIAEIERYLGLSGVKFSSTSFDFVRGVLVTVHASLTDNMNERDLWRLYRKYYSSEPFIRFINDKRSIFRYPDPKLVAGTNYFDLGFAVDDHSDRVVILGALDNLMKGAAGQAVQAMNLMLGFEETMGLEFHGIFPL